MRIYQVDAFTAEPFRGNPAAVCLLDGERPDAWMQALAAEMNLSETAFLLRQGKDYALRWFTPKREVSLCGHATLASAHTLWEVGEVPAGEAIRFHTLSGLLTATREERCAGAAWIALDFPMRAASSAAHHPALEAALGAQAVHTGVAVGASGQTYLLELADEAAVRALAPDFRALRATGVRAVIVTAPAQTAGFDFVSRFFATGLGIDEDPVTGSAHCCLTPYWGARLGKTSLVGLQVSARTGVVRCEWRDERVILRGQAVTMLRGEVVA